MSRVTAFSPGRRWRCTPATKAPFDFVIVGPGTRPDHKRCRIEVDSTYYVRQGYSASGAAQLAEKQGHGREAEYSRRHLRKWAALVPVPE